MQQRRISLPLLITNMLPHYPDDRPDRSEARLCRFSPAGGMPGGTTPPERFAANVVYTPAEWLRVNVGVNARDVASGIFQGLFEAWGPQSLAPDRLRAVRSVVDFVRNAPASAHRELENYVRRERISNPQLILNLTDQNKWLRAFAERDPGPAGPLAMFRDFANDKERKDNASQLVFGEPRAFLRSLDLRTRKEIFLDYVDTNIHSSVQMDSAQRQQMFGRDVAGIEDRFSRIQDRGGYERVLGAVRGVLIGDAPADIPLVPPELQSRGIAVASLHALYPVGVSHELRRDYQNALRSLPSNISPDTIRTAQDLGTNLGPSRLRGLLLLNDEAGRSLMDQARHDALTKEARAILSQREELRGAREQQWQKVTGESREKQRREAMDVASLWSEVPGPMKLIGIIAALFFAKKNPGISTALVAAYFIRKFGFRDPSPTNTGMNMVGGAGRWVSGLNRNLFPWLAGPEADPQEPIRRSQVILEFLPPQVRNRIERQADGFMQLSGLPLGLLANGFILSDAGPGSGTFGRLNVAEGSDIRAQLRRSLQARNLRTSSLDFFNGNQNVSEASDAVAYLFYSMVVNKPEHRALALRVRDGFARLALDKGFADLDADAKDAFKQLVVLGKNEAALRYADQTVYNYMVEATGIQTPPSRETVDKLNQQMVEQNKKELAVLAGRLGPAAEFNFEEDRTNGNIIVQLRVAGVDVPEMRQSIVRSSFQAPRASILFEEWKDHAISVMRARLNVLPPGSTQFSVRRIPGVGGATDRVALLWTRRPGIATIPPNAEREADLLAFLTSTPVNIAAKYLDSLPPALGGTGAPFVL